MKHLKLIHTILFLFFVSFSNDLLSQTDEKMTNNTSNVLVAKVEKEEQVTINFNVTSPVNNALILIRNEKGDLVFMETRHRFQGSYTRTVSLKEAEGKRFDVQIKNDAEQVNRTIIMR